MTSTIDSLPPRLREIIEDFHECEGQEKLELLLEYANNLPPLPERLQGRRDVMDQVHECMTPVFVFAENDDKGLIFHFDIPAESPTVRGYAALLGEGLRGATPDAVLHIPIDFYTHMGLHTVLSAQRLNGISALLAHMKRLAIQTLM